MEIIPRTIDLSAHRLNSVTDPHWVNTAIEKIGEEKFWKYQKWVYEQLDKLTVGQKLLVTKWVENPEYYYLFIKIACCFLSETMCCYEFNTDYTIITHKYDQHDTLDRLSKKIPVQKLQSEIAFPNRL